MKNMCINESLCCTTVINTIQELNYTSVKKNITVRYHFIAIRMAIIKKHQ